MWGWFSPQGLPRVKKNIFHIILYLKNLQFNNLNFLVRINKYIINKWHVQSQFSKQKTKLAQLIQYTSKNLQHLNLFKMWNTLWLNIKKNGAAKQY